MNTFLKIKKTCIEQKIKARYFTFIKTYGKKIQH